MASRATIEQFDGGDFSQYRERLEFYFCANGIGEIASNASNSEKLKEERKMTAHLVSLLSKTVYSTLKTLCLPKSPSDYKYAQIATILQDHYKTKTSRTTATHRFRQCTQNSTEAVTEFSHRLKNIAVDCQFGTHLDRALSDQFVAGLRDLSVRKLILSKTDTDVSTFDKIFQIALTEETAVKFASMMEQEPQSTPVHKLHSSKSKKPTYHRSQSSSKPPRTQFSGTCYRCGSADHLADKCRHANVKCHYCQRIGHMERVCFKKKRAAATSKPCHHVEDEPEGDSDGDSGEDVPLFHVNNNPEKSNHPLIVSVDVNNSCIAMELDTGSGVTVLSERDFKKCNGDVRTLQKPSVTLTGFSGMKIKCIGETTLPVTIAGKTENVLLRVVDNDGPSLLGRDLLNSFTLPWKQMFAERVHRILGTDTIKAEFPHLFDLSTLGKMQGVRVTLHVDDSKPIFHKARTVPYHIRENYEVALDKLERDGVIRKVTHSEWASPTVPVRKPDGSIRVCGDYSVTINKCSKMEHHPLPTLEEMLTKLSGGTMFTKLDLSQAYHQLELSEDSRKYTTINTHRGLYEYTRLPFGVNSAVSIFQRTMENLLADLPGCVVYIDDILVTGKTEEDHMSNLRNVLQRLEESGMKLKCEKIELMSDAVTYLGHRISANGVNATEERITALRNAKQPNDVSELQSFIGSANYVRKFIPHFAEKMAPLYTLLKRDKPWCWDIQEQNAFEEIRNSMSTNATLAHFSLSKDVVLQVDASGLGLGAVLLQPDEEKSLRPVAYASRVLTPAERNYSNIEREALALIFGAHKFRQYLMGTNFTFRTDHKPLLSLYDPLKAVPMLTSTRLKKWRLVLAAYSYKMEYVPGKQNTFADYLSRKPQAGQPSPDELVEEQVLYLTTENIVNAEAVARETRKDPVLSQVLRFTKIGWPAEVPAELTPYFRKQNEISLQNDVLMWDSRIIIPLNLQDILLKDLHSEHSGMVRMKRVARMYVWWPNIDVQIEETVRLCALCQESAKKPAETHGAWSWPAGPWKRLHIDFAGPFLGKMFFVLVDSYSKFVDVVPMTNATTHDVISTLRQNFALFGLPEHIVSDNGSQFTSQEFSKFLRLNGVLHTRTAPGHPATNGLAERYVGHFKSKMKLLSTEDSLQTALYRFLLTYRTTPNASGKSPAELLFNRQPRTRFDLLRPSALQQELRAYDRATDQEPSFSAGDSVYALNFGRHGAKWLPGLVVSVLSPMNYKIQVDDAIWKRHRNQLRSRTVPTSMLPDLKPPDVAVPTTTTTPYVNVPVIADSATPSSTIPVRQPATQPQPVLESTTALPASSTSGSDSNAEVTQSAHDRPRRNIKKPERFRD